jgi:hypothetical protein
MKTVWVYFAKEAQGDEKSDLIIFETEELAQRWLAEKDPEGVVFEYPVEDEEAAGAAAHPSTAAGDATIANGPNQVEHPLGHGDWANAGGKAMNVLAASLRARP